MTAPDASALPVWHDEGRRAASALDRVNSALVVGRDAERAAWVALGIARAQAAYRRVAVADLIGESAPLQALTGAEDDPHGISDSFLYGVSLNRIARPVDDGGNLFLLPSGSEAVAVEEIFRSDRWRRLASGFREVGALLLLVAHADTPGLDALAASVDGVVIAGDAAGALPDAAPPLAVVAGATRRSPRAERHEAEAKGATGDGTGATRRERQPRAAAGGAAAAAASVDEGAGDGKRWLIGGGVLVAAAAAAFAFLALRQEPPAPIAAPPGPPVRGGAAVAAPTPPANDSSARAAAGDSARPAAPTQLRADQVANPADSGLAVAWTVYVVAGNTPEAAALDPRVDLATLPVLTLTPIVDNGEAMYRLLVGAYQRRAEAESLLVALRRRKVLGPGSGLIVRAPYALRLEERIPAAAAAARVRALAERNVPAYPLSLGDGQVALYAGAFETPQQAAFLANTLREAGVAPVLVYRTGRSL